VGRQRLAHSSAPRDDIEICLSERVERMMHPSLLSPLAATAASEEVDADLEKTLAAGTELSAVIGCLQDVADAEAPGHEAQRPVPSAEVPMPSVSAPRIESTLVARVAALRAQCLEALGEVGFGRVYAVLRRTVEAEDLLAAGDDPDIALHEAITDTTAANLTPGPLHEALRRVGQLIHCEDRLARAPILG
jgi:hypothetical protein